MKITFDYKGERRYILLKKYYSLCEYSPFTNKSNCVYEGRNITPNITN